MWSSTTPAPWPETESRTSNTDREPSRAIDAVITAR